MNLRFLLVILALLLPGFCLRLSAGDGREYYLSRHLDGDNGLPQNSIKSIAPDHNGFIWLATESGVVRYDGRKLKIYNKNNSSLRSSRFMHIIPGPLPGNLYAVTDRWQLLEIRESQAQQSNKQLMDVKPPTWPANRHTRGKTGFFAFYHQLHQDVSDSFQLFIGSHRRAMVFNNNSILWNNTPSSKYAFGFPVSIYRFATCNDALYYLKDLSPEGLLEVSPGGIKPAKLHGAGDLAPGARFELLLNDASGEAFLLTGKRLYLLQQDKDRSLHLRLLLDDPLLEQVVVRALYYDPAADRIFIGTSVSGLYIFERKQFQTMTARALSQDANVFYGQMRWDDQSILTGKGYKFTRGRPAEYLEGIGQHADMFGSVIQRYQDGTILTGARKHLYRFSPDGKNLLQTWDIQVPFLISQGSKGQLWLGTEHNGLYRLHPDSMQAPELLAPLNEFITCIREETEQVLWVGTSSNLYRFDLRQRRWDTIGPLKHKSIRSLYFAREKELWVTTDEDGIFLVRNGKVTHMPIDKNGYLKNAHCILEDQQHYFWITTNNGLFQATRTDLLNFAAGKQKKVYYHHYTKEHGFHTNEFNGGGCEPCGISFNRQKSFSFPSLNGLVWFQPAEVHPVLPRNPVILDEVQIDGKHVPATDTLYLDKVSGRISLWIATAYLGNSNNLAMEYKIEGPGNEQNIWNPLVNDFISFNGPGSGTYVLTVRKESGFGADSYVYKNIYIIIPKAFWETWWFVLLVVAGTAGLIFLLIKARVHYLEQRNRELENTVQQRTFELRKAVAQLEDTQQDLNKEVQFQRQLNAIITHDIKTPIQYLALSLKYLSLKKQKEQSADAAALTEIFRASERIYHFTNSLSGYVKVRLGLEQPTLVFLHQLALQKTEMFGQAAEKSGNMFCNLIPENQTLRTHAPLIDILLHNLTDNACKHTTAGTITMSTKETEQGISLSVSDTGKGMPEDQVSFLNQFFSRKKNDNPEYTIGLGYLTIADALEWLQGSITVESRIGTGTTITLQLPELQKG